MLALFVFIFMSQVSVLILLYIADRGLKIVSKNRIKQVEMISLRKSHRNFFVHYRRKEGIITKFAFKCMIAYYIINATGFIAIFIQYVLGDNSFFTITSVIIVFANIGLIFPTGSQPELDFEQKVMLERYLIDERERKKKE